NTTALILNDWPVILSGRSRRMVFSWPVPASHTRAVPSPHPVRRRLPSRLNATLLIAPACPLSAAFSSPVSASHSLASPRSSPPRGLHAPLPVMMRLPSGLNASLLIQFVCPLSAAFSWPVSASHTCAVPSSRPVSSRLPSGLNATLVKELVYPL